MITIDRIAAARNVYVAFSAHDIDCVNRIDSKRTQHRTTIHPATTNVKWRKKLFFIR